MVPTLYGVPSSVYVRSARLALEEKGVPHRLVPVDVFGADRGSVAHLERHPFGRIPAFEHDGFALYETGAIIRYVDEAFEGARLQPKDFRQRGRVNQLLSIADSYLYRTLVWDIFVERVRAPMRGQPANEAVIEQALPKARRCLDAIVALIGDQPFLAGEDVSLADLHVIPMVIYGAIAAEGLALLEEHPTLAGWMRRMIQRPSVIATRTPLEAELAHALR